MADIPAPRLDGRSIHPHVLNTRPWRPSSSWRPWVMTMHPALRVEKRGRGRQLGAAGLEKNNSKDGSGRAPDLLCGDCGHGISSVFFGSSHPRPPWDHWDHCCMKAGLLREAWEAMAISSGDMWEHQFVTFIQDHSGRFFGNNYNMLQSKPFLEATFWNDCNSHGRCMILVTDPGQKAEKKLGGFADQRWAQDSRSFHSNAVRAQEHMLVS